MKITLKADARLNFYWKDMANIIKTTKKIFNTQTLNRFLSVWHQLNLKSYFCLEKKISTQTQTTIDLGAT